MKSLGHLMHIKFLFALELMFKAKAKGHCRKNFKLLSWGKHLNSSIKVLSFSKVTYYKNPLQRHLMLSLFGQLRFQC